MPKTEGRYRVVLDFEIDEENCGEHTPLEWVEAILQGSPIADYAILAVGRPNQIWMEVK